MKHGMWKSVEYQAWGSMIARCERRSYHLFRRYGGRGISVCPQWRHDFMAFFRDIGPRPGPGYSLDRIDNDGNYEPGNVRWATIQQQVENSSAVRLLTHAGLSLSVSEWARRVGFSREAVNARLRAGWSVEDALTRPIDQLRRPVVLRTRAQERESE